MRQYLVTVQYCYPAEGVYTSAGLITGFFCFQINRPRTGGAYKKGAGGVGEGWVLLITRILQYSVLLIFHGTPLESIA